MWGWKSFTHSVTHIAKKTVLHYGYKDQVSWAFCRPWIKSLNLKGFSILFCIYYLKDFPLMCLALKHQNQLDDTFNTGCH